MAGDDDVVIKVSTDTKDASADVEKLKDDFSGIKDVLDAVVLSTGPVAEAVARIGENLGVSLQAAQQHFDALTALMNDRSIKTKAAYEAELAEEKATLALMLENRSEFTERSIALMEQRVERAKEMAGQETAAMTAAAEQQANLEALKLDALTQAMNDRGLKTKAQYESELAAQQQMLDQMLANEEQAGKEAIEIQKARVEQAKALAGQETEAQKAALEAEIEANKKRLDGFTEYMNKRGIRTKEQYEKELAEHTKTLENMLANEQKFTAGTIAEQKRRVASLSAGLAEPKKEYQSFFDMVFKGFGTTTASAVAWGTQLSQAFDKVTDGIKAAVTGFPAMIKHVASAGDEIATLSARIGVTVEDLAELKYMAGQSGADMMGLARTVQSLSGIFAETGEKGADLREAIGKIGLSVENLKKMDPKAAFLEIVQAIQSTIPAADQGRVAMEIFGSKFRANTMILKEDIGALQEKFKELGGGMTTELAKAGDAYADNMANIRQVQENFRQSMVEGVLPAVNNLLEAFPKLGGFAMTMGEGLLSLGKSFVPLITQLIAARLGFMGTAAAENVATVSTKAFDVAVKSLLGPVGLLVAVLGLIAGAAYLAAEAQTEEEAAVDANTIAYKKETDTLADTLKTYDDLHDKLKLTKGETVKLEEATRKLAEATGMSADAFKKDAAAQELAIRGMRELLAGKTKLLALATKEALQAKEKAENDYKLAKAARDAMEATRGTKTVKATAFERGGTAEVPLTDKEQLAAFREANEQVLLLDGRVKNLTKEYEILSGTEQKVADTTKGTLSGFQKLKAELAEMHKVISELTTAQKADIKAGIDAGTKTELMAKALETERAAADLTSHSVEELTKAIDLYKKEMEAAKREMEKTPFARLAKQAKDLAEELAAAKAEGIPMTHILASLGEEAAKLSQQFEMRGKLDALDAGIKQLGTTWQAQELTAQTKDYAAEVAKLGRTFSEKVMAGAAEAAAQAREMTTEIAESILSREELEIRSLEKMNAAKEEAHRASIAGINRTLFEQQNAILAADQELAEKQKKTAGANVALLAELTAKRQADTAAALEASSKQAADAKEKIEATKSIWQKLYEWKQKLQKKETGDYEKDLELLNIISQKKANEAIALAKKTYEKLAEEAKKNPYFNAQRDAAKAELDRLSEQLDAWETYARNHGIVTQKMLLKEVEDTDKALKEILDHRGLANAEAEELAREAAAKALKALKDSQNDIQAWAKVNNLRTRLDAQALLEVERAKYKKMMDNSKAFTAFEIREQKKRLQAAEEVANETALMFAKITTSLQGLGSAFGEGFSQIAGVFASLATDSFEVSEAWDTMSEALKKMDKGVRNIDWKSFSAGAAQAATNVVAGVVNFKKEMESFDGMTMMEGFMAGASIGMVAGPYGAFIGGVVGTIISMFSDSKARQAAHKVGQDTGAIIGEDLANALVETAGDRWIKEIGKEANVAGQIFVDETGKVIRDAQGKALQARSRGMDVSEFVHLGDIVRDTEVVEKNFDKINKMFLKGTEYLKEGRITVEEYGETVRKSFPQLAEQAEKMGGMWSQSFKDVIASIKEVNKESKLFTTDMQAMTDLLNREMSRAAGALTKVMGGFAQNVGPAIEKTLELKEVAKGLAEQRADMLERAGGDLQNLTREEAEELDALNLKIEETAGAIKKVTSEAVVNSQEQFNRVSRISMATFNGMIAQGKTAMEAIEAIGPSIDLLATAQNELGLEANSAYYEMSRLRKLTNENKGLIDSIGGVNEMMSALANLGSLNQETFNDLQVEGMTAFGKLTDAGFSSTEALAQMKPMLETIRRLHAENGLEVDEGTAALVRQAEEQGILSEEAIDTNQVLLQGFAAIIEAVGGTLPEAFKKMLKSSEESNEGVGKSLEKNVTKPLDDAAKKVDKVGWEQFAKNADKAARIVSGSLGKVDDSLSDVDKALAEQDWELWAQEAIDAADAVAKSVDTVSLGSSPGGLKEIPLKMAEAIKAFKQFEEHGVGAAEEVSDAVNSISGARVEIAAGGAEDAEFRIREDERLHNEELMKALSAMTEAYKESQIVLNFDVSTMNADGMKAAVEQDILPTLINAVDRNNRGSLTRLRQMLVPVRPAR